MVAVRKKSHPAMHIGDVVEAQRAVVLLRPVASIQGRLRRSRPKKMSSRTQRSSASSPQAKDAEKHRNSWQQGQKTAQRGQRLQANGQERQRHARCFIGLCHLRSSRQDRPNLRGKRDELQNWYQDDGKDQKQRQPQLRWARKRLQPETATARRGRLTICARASDHSPCRVPPPQISATKMTNKTSPG